MKWTDEKKQFLIDNVKGTSYKDLTKLFNEHFKLNITEKAVSSTLKRFNLTNGRDTQFKKGNIPINKGKKWSEYLDPKIQEICRKTCFKKSDHSFNNANWKEREIGEESIAEDNYIVVKVANNKRIKKHRLIYEKAYGKISEDNIIIFLDGNNRNFELDNLYCITKSENLMLNKKMMRFKDKDLTLSSIQVVKLIETIRSKENGNKKHNDRLE